MQSVGMTIDIDDSLKQDMVDFTIKLYNYRDCKNRNKFKFGSLFKHSIEFDDKRRKAQSKTSQQKEYVNNNDRSDGDIICHIYGNPRNEHTLKCIVRSLSSQGDHSLDHSKPSCTGTDSQIGVYEYRTCSDTGIEMGSFRVIINFTKNLWTYALCVKISDCSICDVDSSTPNDVAYLEWKDRNIENSDKYDDLKKRVNDAAKQSSVVH